MGYIFHELSSLGIKFTAADAAVKAEDTQWVSVLSGIPTSYLGCVNLGLFCSVWLSIQWSAFSGRILETFFPLSFLGVTSIPN